MSAWPSTSCGLPSSRWAHGAFVPSSRWHEPDVTVRLVRPISHPTFLVGIRNANPRVLRATYLTTGDVD